MDRSPEIRSCHVCVNVSCAESGSGELLERLTERLAGSGVELRTHICFGACWVSPNIVLYPEGTWYSSIQPGDLDEIVAHIQGGERVERLVDRSDPQHYELLLSLLEAGLS